MIISVLRNTFAKGKPKIAFYRCYKNFDQDSFNETLKNRISLPNLSFEKNFEIFHSTLDFFIIITVKYNNNPFMAKRLTEAALGYCFSTKKRNHDAQ